MAPVKYHYLYRSFTYLIDVEMVRKGSFWCSRLSAMPVDLCQRHLKMGSLAGAAHLLNNNAGVQR